MMCIEEMTCDACGRECEGSAPFDEFECRRCRKVFTLCAVCVKQQCPRCKGQLRNADERSLEEEDGGLICW